MKKTAFFLIVLAIAVVGCNQPDPISSNTPLSTTVQSQSGPAQTTSHDSSIAPPAANEEVEQFNADLNRLAELAQDSEAKYDFVSAAKIWGQMRQLM